MKAVSNPIASAALNRALSSVRAGPSRRPHYDSRTADKFVIRGYEELFAELDGIGRHQGRSRNSETVAAILEALSGYARSSTMLTILKEHLGAEVADLVLAEVPSFELESCIVPGKFNVRLPPSMRDMIRDGVASAAGNGSMNKWLLNALVEWVKLQRQHYALLSTAIALNQPQLVLDPSSKQ